MVNFYWMMIETFVEKCVRNRSIIDLDRICDIISNYFIHVRTKSTDNVCGNVCFDMLSSLKILLFNIFEL